MAPVPRRDSQSGPALSRNRVLAIAGVTVLVLAIVGILSSFGGVDDSKDTAKIDDVGSISIPTFNHWYLVVSKQPQPGQKKAKPPPPLDSTQGQALKKQVMQFLISSDWILGEAKERGLTATPTEIQDRFKQTKKQSFPNEKAYTRFLQTSGQTLDDLLFRVRLDVLSNKIREDVTKGTADVGNSSVQDYYNKNKQQFTQPERRDLEVILTKTPDKAAQAKQEVGSGKNWAKVAKQLSTDPASKNQGGKLLGVTKGQQDPTFDAAIFKATQGTITGPVKTGAGYYVFRVTKVTPGSTQSLQASTAGIKQLLISQAQQKKLDTFATTFRNDWRQKTDCAPKYVIPDCRNGREAAQTTPQPTVPGQKKPIPGASHAAPPALDGTGATLATGSKSGGDTVIGAPQNAAAAAGGLSGIGGSSSSSQTAALALGGAPQKNAGGTPGGIPGLTPGGAGGATPGGATQGGGAQGGAGGTQ
jgi:foldase protein PrsA